ncbi:DNA polymerase III subunit chi [soil metagenome]
MADGAAPCEVWFYHLERAAPEAVLAELLEKTLARGWRARVKTTSPDRLRLLDDRLWTDRPEGFLPHGCESEANAERQPILLGVSDENLNCSNALFLMDGAESGPLDGYARCIDLFDGGDPQAVQGARSRWKTAKASGLPVSYWRQTEGGRWEKQA